MYVYLTSIMRMNILEYVLHVGKFREKWKMAAIFFAVSLYAIV